MIRPVFSIFDSTRGSYNEPFVFDNDATALRAFAESVNSNPSLKFKPGDYSLYKIGRFDSDVGILLAANKPEFVCNGTSVLEVKKDEE